MDNNIVTGCSKMMAVFAVLIMSVFHVDGLSMMETQFTRLSMTAGGPSINCGAKCALDSNCTAFTADNGKCELSASSNVTDFCTVNAPKTCYGKLPLPSTDSLATTTESQITTSDPTGCVETMRLSPNEDWIFVSYAGSDLVKEFAVTALNGNTPFNTHSRSVLYGDFSQSVTDAYVIEDLDSTLFMFVFAGYQTTFSVVTAIAALLAYISLI